MEVVFDELEITRSDLVCDPFVGAGSTLIACKERGISGHGIDVLPISVWITNRKLQEYDYNRIKRAASGLFVQLHKHVMKPEPVKRGLGRYLGPGCIQEVETISASVDALSEDTRPFFELALLRSVFDASFVTRDGGWLRWKTVSEDLPDKLRKGFTSSVRMMMQDIAKLEQAGSAKCFAIEGDSRLVKPPGEDYRLVVGSPPYLNRHDYTRILSVELLTLFAETMEELKPMRYSTMRSHVEARAPNIDIDGTSFSKSLKSLMCTLEEQEVEARIRSMIAGYFADIVLVLKNISRYLKPKGYVSFVLSDARFSGILIPVREIATEIATELGMHLHSQWIVRWRGNSSQQMGQFGRAPAAEAILTWQK